MLFRSPQFQRSFVARDTASLSRQLDSQFHQYFETANVIKLEKLRAFDTSFSFVAESSEGSSDLAGRKSICPTLIKQARSRQGAERLQIVSDLCPVADRLYHAVIVPIGGLRPIGYLQIITDPIHNLSAIEMTLGMPVKIALASGQVLYKSREWFPPHAMERTLVAVYPLETSFSGKVMNLAIMQDIRSLHEKLSMTRYMIMMVAGLVTLLVIAIALLVLQSTTLRPLMALHDQLRRVRKDRTRLSESLTPAGTLEIKELAQDFNALSAELGDVHRMLERQAFTDTLTDLPNRSHFHERLRQCTAVVRVTQRPFSQIGRAHV